MQSIQIIKFINNVIENRPDDWLDLTTHRLDIYEEKLAKVQFLEGFEQLYESNIYGAKALSELPTAFDYIRLGHPLSCVLEWTIAKLNSIESENVICFSSKTAPIFAVLRENLLKAKKTRILYIDYLPSGFDEDVLRNIYRFNFDLEKIDGIDELSSYEGSTILVSEQNDIDFRKILSHASANMIDFFVNTLGKLGSCILVNGEKNKSYISEIQHVRRRETIAMTPANSLIVLMAFAESKPIDISDRNISEIKANVLMAIQNITDTFNEPLVGSSGLSIQYAIMMGLVHNAYENHPDKDIKFIVPPNCYGGTNDQARRVAACIDNVEIVDLPVDGEDDMVDGVNKVLEEIAKQDAIPYIIAEIPTNPRVEVPNLVKLQEALSKERLTSSGGTAIAPVFVLDQTFCPNIHFLDEGAILSKVKSISYSSGSKFPSGGKCTAGYCVINKNATSLVEKVKLHLSLCDNNATALQYEILAKQMPSMIQRIADAYQNTRSFVNYIKEVLPTAKINFVSEELAEQGFTPSVFSLDLPTKGVNEEERDTYKRELNHKLINMMITQIPNESKYCVSYGQLKGCYWTIPATSTQGTTKEGDKDYIARVALSPDMDLEKHKEVFLEFVMEI